MSYSPPSINHQSRDGPFKIDQIGLDSKKLFSPEDIQKEKERHLPALKEADPKAFADIQKMKIAENPPS